MGPAALVTMSVLLVAGCAILLYSAWLVASTKSDSDHCDFVYKRLHFS
jgi:hypothetical protein